MRLAVGPKFCLLLCLSILAVACAAPDTRPRMPTGSSLAVASFTNPLNTWELLAGNLPEQNGLVDEAVILNLDLKLGETLRQRGVQYVSEPVVGQCVELASREPQEQPRTAALRHWLRVGKCVPADYLLVPQTLYLRERRGGDWSAEEPASLIMDFFLLDVRNEAILRRYRFEETQQSLSENLLDFDKFVSRGGKWVSALELAQEGIEQALKELGL